MVKQKHILFIVENNSVPFDVRVWNEALAAKDFGYAVSVVCPKSKKAPKSYEEVDGISIYRHFAPIEADKKFSFLFEYFNALIWELIYSLYIFVRKPFQIIHSANPPDHISIIATIYKLFNVKFVFDHHDICPENYLAKFAKKDTFYYTLKAMEKFSFFTADTVISTNESYKKIAICRGNKKPEDVFVVRNGPNIRNIMFPKPNNELKEGFEFLVVYVGTIGNQEGIENLLEAVEYIVYERSIKKIKFVVIGTGPNWKEMVDLSKKKKLEGFIRFTGYIPYKNFYEYLATADIGVNPEHRNEFTDKSTMIKIMDYMVFGKPIVQFKTTEGQVTAGESSIYIKQNDNKKYGDAIIELLMSKEKRIHMSNIAKDRIANKLNWDIQKINLLDAYRHLEK